MVTPIGEYGGRDRHGFQTLAATLARMTTNSRKEPPFCSRSQKHPENIACAAAVKSLDHPRLMGKTFAPALVKRRDNGTTSLAGEF